MAEGRRYLFHPLERRGVVVGLQPEQLGALAGGGVLALVLVALVPGTPGFVAALTAVGVGTASACWPVAGRPPVFWMPVAVGWLRRRAGGPRLARLPVATGSLRRPGPATPQQLPGRPADGRLPKAERARRPAVSRNALVAGTHPSGMTLVEAPAGPGAPAMAVIQDRHAGTWAAVIPVRGRSLALLEPSERERRLGAWGAILAGLARAGSPVQLMQWVEASSAGDAEDLARYLSERGAPSIDTRVATARESYAELIAEAGPASQEHRILVVLAVRPRRGRQPGGLGRGHDAAVDLLRREVRLLQGQLRNADLAPSDPLELSHLALTLRGASEPGPSPGRSRRAVAAAVAIAPWPMGTDEAWSALRADGAWHSTYWVAEWPRLEVGPDFLAPLLLTSGHRRISVLMAPVPPERAARQIESARTADAADEELRRRAGFLATARRQRQAEGVARREAELADGHAEYRFSGYVTVTAAGRSELDVACAEIEQAAQQAHLDLRRLYGQQAEAFTWTQPLARGLR